MQMDDYRLIHPILPRKDYGKIMNVTKAEGIFVYSEAQEILDGLGGLWNVILGHGNKEIEQAIAEQMAEVGFINPWTCCTDIVYKLADKLIHFADGDFAKTMFTCTGSEAVELAIKLARRHQAAKEKHEKKYIAVFETSYHGTHYGSMTATGVDREYYGPYGPMLQGFAYLPIPFESKHTTQGAIQSLEKFFNKYGEKLGGFLLEPILGVSGVVKLPDVYVKRLKELCREYDVLLIFDEISTGFYRTGPKFAYQEMNIKPDILCLSKGMNNGVLPLGAVLIGNEVAQMIQDHDFINHFSTQNANPLCCAAGVKTIEILERENYGKIVKHKGTYFKQKLEELEKEVSFIKEVRIHGLMIGIELEMENDFSKILEFVTDLKEEGLLAYPYNNKYSTGIMLLPPYIVTLDQIDSMVTILKNTIVKQIQYS